MPSKYHFVYQTKNIVSGKTYIGVHSTNNINDGYIGNGIKSKAHLKSTLKNSNSKSYFVKAVEKYGYENFRVEILSFFDTPEEAYEEEAYLVDNNWVSSNQNYNITLGGRGGSPKKYLEKYDAIKNDYLNGVLIKDIEHKYSVSISVVHDAIKNVNKNLRNVENIFINKYKSTIEKAKPLIQKNTSISKMQSILNVDYKTVKKIIRILNIPKQSPKEYVAINKENYYEFFQCFDTISNKLNLSKEGIRQVLNGKISSFKGWFFMSTDGFNIETFKFPVTKYDKFIGLKLIDPNGSIHILDTDLTSFCKKYNLTNTNIHAMLKGNQNTHKGWKLYKN